MSQDENNKQSSFINIQQLINAYIHNWKWVALSVIVFLILGIIVYKKQIPVCEVSAQVLISDEGSKATASISEVASMFGGGSFGANRSVEDEMVIVKSHSLLRETVEQLEMNVGYVVRKNLLKKYNVYYNQPVKLIYDKNIADTLGCLLTFKINVDDKGVADVIVRGGIKNKVILKKSGITLPQTLDTPYGSFTLVEGSGYVKGKDLDETITLMNYDAMALILNNLISVDYSAKKTDIMTLSFITTDARFGQSLLDTLVKNYNNVTIEQKRSFNRKTLQFLEERIAILSAEVDSTQAQVEAFMGRRDLVNPVAQAGIYIQRTSAQEVDLARAEAEYELLTMAIDFLSNEANNTSMLPIMPSTASLSPLIEGYNQLILDRLTIESSAKGDNIALKAINTRISAVRDNLLTALSKQAETADVEIAEMRRQYSKNKKRLDTMPGIEREFSDITRQQSLKEQLYVYLLRQREETEMAIAGAHPRGVIIDEAYITDSKLDLRYSFVLIAFFIFGFAVPGVFFLLKWRVSKYVLIPDQAIDLSGNKPFIARIRLQNGLEPVVCKEPQSAMSKGIRLLRSNMFAASNMSKNTVTSIIGTVNNDNSARVALNFAMSIALTGRRTILVEANPFEPIISRLIDIQLKDELSFDCQIDDSCVSALKLDNRETVLNYMQCSKNEYSGDDIIESVYFESLIRKFRSDYDAIVISTPSIVNNYSAVEALNGMSDITFATVELGKTTKNDISKLEHLEVPVSGIYLVELVNVAK